MSVGQLSKRGQTAIRIRKYLGREVACLLRVFPELLSPRRDFYPTITTLRDGLLENTGAGAGGMDQTLNARTARGASTQPTARRCVLTAKQFVRESRSRVTQPGKLSSLSAENGRGIGRSGRGGTCGKRKSGTTIDQNVFFLREMMGDGPLSAERVNGSAFVIRMTSPRIAWERTVRCDSVCPCRSTPVTHNYII